jgi:DNA-binding transcriptional LysR family regulator
VSLPPHLTLRALEIFLAVAEAGSMVGAAKRLGTSTSAISQQITNLESGLEVVLFDRALRPMGLTPAGLLLQHHAVGILDGVDRARAALVDMRLGALPSLRLAIIDSLDAGITPRLVAGLSEEHPETRITAWSGRSEEHRKALSDRLVDVIVTSDPMEDVERLERHRLMVEPFILIAAKGLYDPGAGNPVAQLEARPFVRYSGRMPLGRDIERHMRRLRFAPAPRYEFDSTRSVFAMAADRGGWAVTTPLCFLDGRRFHDGLDAFPLPFAQKGREIDLIARAGEMGTLPRRLADRIRGLIAEHTMPDLRNLLPWAADEIRLGDAEG